MNKREKEILIEKLLKPEASNGSGLGVAGAGLLVLGAMSKGIGVGTIATAGLGVLVSAAGIVGPLCVAGSLGGMAYLTIRKIFNKEVPAKAVAEEKEGA